MTKVKLKSLLNVFQSVPVVTTINGGFSNDRMVYICGTPRYGAQRFTINLQERDDPNPGDIGLHFDVRINAGGVRDVVVRNNCEGGSWGIEERDTPYFPFRSNEKFYLIIHATWDKYIISVNNQPFVHFRLRGGPLHKYSVINVKGDIDLTEVSYQ